MDVETVVNERSEASGNIDTVAQNDADVEQKPEEQQMIENYAEEKEENKDTLPQTDDDYLNAIDVEENERHTGMPVAENATTEPTDEDEKHPDDLPTVNTEATSAFVEAVEGVTVGKDTAKDDTTVLENETEGEVEIAGQVGDDIDPTADEAAATVSDNNQDSAVATKQESKTESEQRIRDHDVDRADNDDHGREDGDGDSMTLPQEKVSPPNGDYPYDHDFSSDTERRTSSTVSRQSSEESFRLNDIPLPTANVAAPPLVTDRTADILDQHQKDPELSATTIIPKLKKKAPKKNAMAIRPPIAIKKKKPEVLKKDSTATLAVIAAGNAVAQVAFQPTIGESKLRGKIRSLQKKLNQVKEENKAMRSIQRRQEQAIVKLEGRRSEDAMLALCDRYNEEVRVLKLLLRRQKDELREKERLMRSRDQLLQRASARSRRLQSAVKELQGKDGYNSLVKDRTELQNELQRKENEVEQLHKQMEDTKSEFEQSFQNELLKQKKIRLKLKRLQRMKTADTHTEQSFILRQSVLVQTLPLNDAEGSDSLCTTPIKLPPINSDLMSSPAPESHTQTYHVRGTPPPSSLLALGSSFGDMGLNNSVDRRTSQADSILQASTTSDVSDSWQRRITPPTRNTSNIELETDNPFADLKPTRDRKGNTPDVLEELFAVSKPKRQVVTKRKVGRTKPSISDQLFARI